MAQDDSAPGGKHPPAAPATPGEREHIVALDKECVWHPYTAMDDYRKRVDPIVVSKASGVRIFDVDGRSYIDANASWWTSTLGHNHPRVVAALKEQADKLCHAALAGITHAPAAELAARSGAQHGGYN